MDIEKPVDQLVICIEGKINGKPIGTLFNDGCYQHRKHLDEDLIKNGSGIYAYLSFAKLKQTLQNMSNKITTTINKKRE